MRLNGTGKLAAVLLAAALAGSSAAAATSATSAEVGSVRPAGAQARYADYPREGQPNLYTADPDRLSRFYQRLSFVEVYRMALPDGSVAFTTLQKGPFYLTLTSVDLIRQATNLREALGGAPQQHQSDLTVLVSDVDTTVARLRLAGTRVILTPTTQPWGERQAFVTDPDGNYVQLSTHNQ